MLSSYTKKLFYEKDWQILPLAICLFTIGLYYYCILRFTINFPVHDDYAAILDFIIKYKNADTLGKKAEYFFSFHNEHRIIFCRLISILQYEFFGQVNFYWHNFIGNLGWLLVWICFWFSVRRKDVFNWWYMVPPTLLMFQFHHYEIIFYPMASLSGIWVLGFASLTLLLLQKEREIVYFILAIVFAIITTFTQGNGWLVFPAGIALLINERKGRYLLILWILMGLLMLILYFIGFQFQDPKQGAIPLFSFTNFRATFLFLFTFFGSWITGTLIWMQIFGISTLIISIWSIRLGIFKNQPFLIGLLVFLLLTMLEASFLRAQFGIGTAIASRYSINLVLFFTVIWLGFITRVWIRARIFVIFSCSVAAFCIGVYSYHARIRWMLYAEKRTHQFVINAKNGQLPDNFDFFWAYTYPDKGVKIKILKEAEKEGIFNIRKM